MATLSDLTPRETQMLLFVLAGLTNREIAAELVVSEKTVEFHLRNIYTKVGVRKRSLATIWAIQQGVNVEMKHI
jgi:DNA-binding NarL/FixJ family response regulator